MNKQIVSSKINRNYIIDLFRFIAAISVALYHYSYGSLSRIQFDSTHDTFLPFFFKYGYLGVDFFFLISGYVIFLSAEKKSIIQFIRSRFIRLYPAYWICLSLTFSFIILFGQDIFNVSIKQFVVNLSMVHTLFKVEHIDSVYWTLFVELKFYIFIAVLILIRDKFNFSFRPFIILWFLMSLTPLLFDFSSRYLFRLFNSTLILNWSSYFIAGMLFFRIYKFGILKKYIFSIVLTMILSVLNAVKFANKLFNDFQDENFSIFVVAGIVVVFYLIMFLAATNKFIRISSPKLFVLGAITYPLYLIHHHVGIIILRDLNTIMNYDLVVVSLLIFMILVAYLIYRFGEQPFSKLIGKLFIN